MKVFWGKCDFFICAPGMFWLSKQTVGGAFVVGIISILAERPKSCYCAI